MAPFLTVIWIPSELLLLLKLLLLLVSVVLNVFSLQAALDMQMNPLGCGVEAAAAVAGGHSFLQALVST